jgi:hypothetical protein
MSQLSLALVAVVVVIASATFAPSRIVRAQSAARFEYARVTPFIVNTVVSANRVQQTNGYRACVAGTTEWTCRDFKPTESTDTVRTALATLGSEGWELVSVVDENPPDYNPHGLTYFFKRPR